MNLEYNYFDGQENIIIILGRPLPLPGILVNFDLEVLVQDFLWYWFSYRGDTTSQDCADIDGLIQTWILDLHEGNFPDDANELDCDRLYEYCGELDELLNTNSRVYDALCYMQATGKTPELIITDISRGHIALFLEQPDENGEMVNVY